MQAYFEIYREFEQRISYIHNVNDNCRAHFHSNIEILLVESGCVEATVRGLSRRLYAGDIAIAASYEPHGFETVGESSVNVWLFPSETVPDFISMTAEGILSSPFLTASPRAREIATVLENLRPQVDCEITLSAKGYMYAVLGILVEELGLSRRLERHQPDGLVRQLLIYIEEHFLTPLTLSELSHAFGYHKDYLSKVFNSRIGCGFNRYINVLRSRHAHHLIDTTRMSLDEISLASGFQCMKSFRRAFLDYYGQTPYEYRRSRSEQRA
ncbi:MAG: helix-turn-helix domain-containing protein [Clostridia bacterium]|nr:helix-turn-helix domain-containing protein [Clostridia bacterium]